MTKDVSSWSWQLGSDPSPSPDRLPGFGYVIIPLRLSFSVVK